jgi:hypothetical protein
MQQKIHIAPSTGCNWVRLIICVFYLMETDATSKTLYIFKKKQMFVKSKDVYALPQDFSLSDSFTSLYYHIPCPRQKEILPSLTFPSVLHYSCKRLLPFLRRWLDAVILLFCVRVCILPLFSFKSPSYLFSYLRWNAALSYYNYKVSKWQN